jgi:hypothetical protein
MQVWPRFEPKQDAERPNVRFRDVDTGSSWTGTGAWAAGNSHYKGQRLAVVPVDDAVDWTVMKYWYPELELHRDTDKPATASAPATPTPPAKAAKPASSRGSRRTVRNH